MDVKRYGLTTHRRQYEIDRQATTKRKDYKHAQIAAWKDRNKGKVRAHNILAYAVRSGVVIRPDKCEKCSSMLSIHGHHTNYSKPLDVAWLCAACHRLEHAKR